MVRAAYTSRFTPSPSLLPLVHRHELAFRRAGKQLARPSDLLIDVANQFVPLRYPADSARERENRREHRNRDAERLVDDARVEIDIRVKLALDEIFVLEGDFLERKRKLEEPVVLQIELFEHLVAGFLDDLGAWVVALVHTVPEPEQHRVVFLLLHFPDEGRDAFRIADFIEHLENGFVRTAMRGTPKTRDARGNAGKRIGAGRARKPHGRGGCILLSSRVQDQDALHRAREDGIGLPLFAWR